MDHFCVFRFGSCASWHAADGWACLRRAFKWKDLSELAGSLSAAFTTKFRGNPQCWHGPSKEVEVSGMPKRDISRASPCRRSHRSSKPGISYETGSDDAPGRPLGPDTAFFAGDGPSEWVRPIPKALERSWHASGPSFRPNH